MCISSFTETNDANQSEESDSDEKIRADEKTRSLDNDNKESERKSRTADERKSRAADERKSRGMADRPLPVPVENEPYYMNVDRAEAENLLRGQPDGTFVLRPSSQVSFTTLTVALRAVRQI